MIVHPQGLSDRFLYAIDQHILRGGDALLFLDPNADSMVGRSPQGNLIPAGMSSELPGLLDAWGLEFDNSKVLADNELALRVMMGQGQRAVPHLGMLGVQGNFLTQGDIITNRLETINLSSAGAISQSNEGSLSFEPLIISSSDAMLMDRAFVENVTDPNALFDEFKSENRSFVIAARLSGLIETAFPEGQPAIPVTEEESSSDDADGEVSVAENTSSEVDVVNEESEIAHLSTSLEPTNIVVFADSFRRD